MKDNTIKFLANFINMHYVANPYYFVCMIAVVRVSALKGNHTLIHLTIEQVTFFAVSKDAYRMDPFSSNKKSGSRGRAATQTPSSNCCFSNNSANRSTPCRNQGIIVRLGPCHVCHCWSSV
ncbi:Uncharacterized protein Fot_10424 [Forsythia ovata]|uniref:Uncharacterized protein n=1 Tax=Forsythia ovata TaxID=205694 RepID=A0ABD1WGS4_9LAMI